MKNPQKATTELGKVVRLVASAVNDLPSHSLAQSEVAECLRFAQQLQSLGTSLQSRMLRSSGVTGVQSAQLVAATGISSRQAKRAVRLAETINAAPAVSQALAQGEITDGHVEALTFMSALNRRAASNAPGLMAAAKSQGVDEFQSTVKQWEARAEGDLDGTQTARLHRQKRRASWFTTANGMTRIEAELPADTGAVVVGVLEKISERLWRTEDGRTAGGNEQRTVVQRNADALIELSGYRPVQEPGTPRHINTDLVVHIDYQALVENSSKAGLRCHTENGAPVPLATVRRLACHAGVIPMVMNGKSQPMDIGRKSRAIPAALHTALAARDAGCQFPGCDRPVSWCEAHHIKHWADGGKTSLDNLVLLCSTHHHVIHEGFWNLRPAFAEEPGSWTFLNPSGHPILNKSKFTKEERKFTKTPTPDCGRQHTADPPQKTRELFLRTTA